MCLTRFTLNDCGAQTGHLLLGEQCPVLCSGLGEGLVGDAESAARGERLESGRADV